MRTAFHVHDQNRQPTVSDLVRQINSYEEQKERVTIDLTVRGRTTTCIEDLAPIWTETGQIVPPRRNPWRVTRGNRVSRHLSSDTRDFQCHFLCSNDMPTEEIPELELVPHHLTFAIPTPCTDVTEESELIHSFMQIPESTFAFAPIHHSAVQAQNTFENDSKTTQLTKNMTSLPSEPDPLVVPETVTSETDTPLVPETVFQLDGLSQVESLDGESFA